MSDSYDDFDYDAFLFGLGAAGDGEAEQGSSSAAHAYSNVSVVKYQFKCSITDHSSAFLGRTALGKMCAQWKRTNLHLTTALG